MTLRKLTIAFFILFFGLFLLEKAFDFWLLQNTNNKASYVSTNAINADVVFAGSSNLLYSIDVPVLEYATNHKIYNLATNHAGLADMYAHLYLYLKYNVSPKKVILGLSLPDETLSESPFHPYLFAPSINDTAIAKLTETEQPCYRYANFIPMGKYAMYNQQSNYLVFEGLKHWLTKQKTPYYPTGTYKAPQGEHFFDGYYRFKQAHPIGVLCCWTENDAYLLAKIANLCKQKSIDLVVVEPPFWQDAKPYFIDRTERCEAITELLTPYHFQYHYSTNDTDTNWAVKNNFGSAFHLNEKGAKIWEEELVGLLR